MTCGICRFRNDCNDAPKSDCAYLNPFRVLMRYELEIECDEWYKDYKIKCVYSV